MADAKVPLREDDVSLEERAQHQPPEDAIIAGAPPLATNEPMPVEDMAQQTPPRSIFQRETDKAPSNRTSDKQTERDEEGHYASIVPGAAKEG